MARVPQVTRTIQTTKAKVLCLNLAEEAPFTQEVVLPRTYKDEKQMMKQVESVVNSDTIKAVHITDYTVEETLYGMTEQEFIEKAKILPPRTGKTDADTEDNSNTENENNSDNENNN